MTQELKPHKGTIIGAMIRTVSGCNDDYPEHLGYYISGRFKDHPQFAGHKGYTSMVIKHEGNEIETYNSRYTIEGDVT